MTQDATALAEALEHIRSTIEAVEKCRDSRPLVFTLTHSDPISVGDLRAVYAALRATPQTPDAVREALRKLAIIQCHRMTHGGGTVHVGYVCKVCNTEWDRGQLEHHKPDCALSTPSASAGPQAGAVKESLHYLWAIKVRLELLYEMSTLDSRLLEQLSDEVDWVDTEIGRLRAHPQQQQADVRAGLYYKTRGDKYNLPQIVGPLQHNDDGECPWSANVCGYKWIWNATGHARADNEPHNRDLIENVTVTIAQLQQASRNQLDAIEDEIEKWSKDIRSNYPATEVAESFVRILEAAQPQQADGRGDEIQSSDGSGVRQEDSARFHGESLQQGPDTSSNPSTAATPHGKGSGAASVANPAAASDRPSHAATGPSETIADGRGAVIEDGLSPVRSALRKIEQDLRACVIALGEGDDLGAVLTGYADAAKFALQQSPATDGAVVTRPNCGGAACD